MVEAAMGTGSMGMGSIMALLADIEQEHPVAEWQASGLGVWPVVRVRLAQRMYRRLDGRPPIAGLSPGAVARRAGRAAAGVFRNATVRDRPGPAGSGASSSVGPSVVVLSDGRSYTDAPDGPVDRFADPLRSALEAEGARTSTVVPGYLAPAGLRGPVQRIQTALDVRVARARLRRLPAPALPGYDAVRARAAVDGVGDDLMSPREIAFTAAAIGAMAATYERELRRAEASLGCVVEYYALQALPFVLACRRLGIPSVDLQHGVQGPTHFAYSSWHARPDESSLMPDRFLVWSEVEAREIAAWAPEGPARSIVAGNLLLHHWRAGTYPGRDDARRQAADLPGPQRLVLVALSGEEDDAFVDLVLEAARRGGDGVGWAIRAHPIFPDRDRWVQRARAKGLTNVDVDAATQLPLFALLERASVVVTRFSSIALDAVPFGVPTLLLDPIGAEVFADLVAAGWASVGDLGELDAVRAPGPAPDQPPAEPAIAALLELAGAPR